MNFIAYTTAFLTGITIGSIAIAAASTATDPVTIINILRTRECAHAASTALTSHAALQVFATQLAKGANTQQAERRSGYLFKESTLIRISGADSEALHDVLRQQYCSTLNAASWQHIAIVQQKQNWWIVLAAPHELPGKDTATAVLALVNQARSKPRQCGTQTFASAPAMQLNTQLNAAAQQQANDMAQHTFMEHRGSDGSTPAQRITHQGYRWTTVGENVAAGPGSASEVMAGWLASPGHCANIMNPRFTEMGVAFAINQNDEFGVYWSQTFGLPRH